MKNSSKSLLICIILLNIFLLSFPQNATAYACGSNPCQEYTGCGMGNPDFCCDEVELEVITCNYTFWCSCFAGWDEECGGIDNNCMGCFGADYDACWEAAVKCADYSWYLDFCT